MLIQRKLIRVSAPEFSNFRRSGWMVYRPRAFKNVAPEVLAKMDPIPKMRR